MAVRRETIKQQLTEALPTALEQGEQEVRGVVAALPGSPPPPPLPPKPPQ